MIDERASVAIVFTCLSDANRRAVLEAISRSGRASASALARELTISRQGIAKHVALLAEAGLVTSTRVGREVLYSVRPEPLHAAARWLDDRASTWDRRLAGLKRAAESQD